MLLFLGTAKDWLIDGIGSTTLDAVSGSQQFYTWALVFFALLGGFAGLRRGRQTLLPLLCFSYFLAVVSLFYFQTRYRLPAMPFVLIFAAYGLSVAGRRLERVFPESRGFGTSPASRPSPVPENDEVVRLSSGFLRVQSHQRERLRGGRGIRFRLVTFTVPSVFLDSCVSIEQCPSASAEGRNLSM